MVPVAVEWAEAEVEVLDVEEDKSSPSSSITVRGDALGKDAQTRAEASM